MAQKLPQAFSGRIQSFIYSLKSFNGIYWVDRNYIHHVLLGSGDTAIHMIDNDLWPRSPCILWQDCSILALLFWPR